MIWRPRLGQSKVTCVLIIGLLKSTEIFPQTSGHHRRCPGSAPLFAILYIITNFRAQIKETGAFHSHEANSFNHSSFTANTKECLQD